MIFLVLCVGLLVAIKPLSDEDLEMVSGLNEKIVPLLRWFARSRGKEQVFQKQEEVETEEEVV
jgi:hypothetical protein